MPWTSEHLDWLQDTGNRLKTKDGLTVEVWEFNHKKNKKILKAWAKHFRNHYCSDAEIDLLKPKHLSRKDYLIQSKFPSKTEKPGPSIRAGDFGEILLGDYLEWKLGYWVPRLRWDRKMSPNESLKGTDIIGFYFDKNKSSRDILAIYEAKTKFRESKVNRMEVAVTSSAVDHARVADSLNYLKQRFWDKQQLPEFKKIERFQNPTDDPYKDEFGAATLYSNETYSKKEIQEVNCKVLKKTKKSKTTFEHPNRDKLVLIAIRGDAMMDLVHALYERAANEA